MNEGIVIDKGYYSNSKPLPDYTGNRARYPIGPVTYYQENPAMFGLYSKVQKYR